MKIAWITVSSDSFLPGTMVLFHSLLRHNPDFTGDLIVIDGGLSQSARMELSKRFNIRFVQPSEQLMQQLNRVVVAFPAYYTYRSRFYSLEAFSAVSYDQVVFFDSDVFCVGSVSELRNINAPFAACADPRYYEGLRRNAVTLAPVPPGVSKGTLMDRLFNTGMMVIGGDFLTGQIYQSLLDELVPETFKSVVTGHTDTVVLNKVLLRHVYWLDPGYNVYATLPPEKLPSEMTPRLIHFIKRSKPWKNGVQTPWTPAWCDARNRLYND